MDSTDQRRTLLIALVLNAVMFIVEFAGGLLGDSSGLLADSLDMLADASAYTIALVAITRGARFKARAAALSGTILLALGIGAIVATLHRAIYGSEPEGVLMAVIAGAALVVNATVLRMLYRYREGEVHLSATWIFTRADVVANAGVTVAAGLVVLTRSRLPDLIAGFLIGLWVSREAIEILKRARRVSHEA